jgi:hypothetical protein
MNRGRVGEERGGKEIDICPLTAPQYMHCQRCRPLIRHRHPNHM